MKMISGVYWEKGGRIFNQDSVTLQQVMTGRGRVLLAAVSDGIGSLKEGEVASGYILESIVHVFYEQMLGLMYKGKGRKSLKRCMLRCFYQINQDLNAYAREKEIRLGATISVLIIQKRRYMIAHLGDSRIYLCHGNKMQKLTTDHASEKGLIRCLGSFGFQQPDVKFGCIFGKKGFLLCTDGFYRRLKEREAGEILSPCNMQEELWVQRRLSTLGKSVFKQGEQDNCSAVYVKVW